METLFELTFQDQTLTPQVGTFTDASQATGTFTLEDDEYYLTNGDTKGFYAYSPVALQSGLVDDSKVIIEFDLKVVTASVNTHTIIGTYAGVDGSGIPTGAKITLQYNAGDIELVLDSGATATLIESADVVVDQWYHFRIDCFLAAPLASTYQVKIDGVSVTTVTGATTDYELGIISVLGTDLHACDECGIKNITLVTETNLYVGRTALDQVLQDVKGYVDNQVEACIPRTGGDVVTGSSLGRVDDTGVFQVCGGQTGADGGSISLTGKNRGVSDGAVELTAYDGVDSTGVQILPDGTMTKTKGTSTKNFAMAEDVVPRSGGAVLGKQFARAVDNDSLDFFGGTGYAHGAFLQLLGKNDAGAGAFNIMANNGTASKVLTGKSNGTLTWNGQSIQTTSDQRLKQQITEIDDKLLDAWSDVDLVQFKYNDAVDQKGKDKARLHTGYVVQQIDNACKEHGVDISAYGLYCHEEYPERTEEVEVEQKDGTIKKETRVIEEASEHYSLRYTEVYAVECMYLRRCIARLTARIEELEKEREASK